MLMTRGKLTAYVVVAIFIGVIAFLGARSASGPQLYPGDTLENRDCRWCNGTGKDSAGTCPACAGTRKLQVILPGAKHPVNVKGSVRDQAAFPNGETPGNDTGDPAKPFQPLKGAVHDAKLVFKGPGGSVEIAGQATGRFRCALEPGDYNVTVSAKDFKDSQQSLTVPPLKQPVWQIKGHLREPDKDAETVNFTALLSH